MTRAIDGTSVSRSDKTPWEGLSMAEKAALMKEAVDNGVYDLKAVRSGYDSFVKVAEPVVEEVPLSEPPVTDGVPLDKLRRSLEDFYVNIEPNVYAGGGNKGRQRVNPLKQQFLNTMEQALKESSSHNSAQWRKFLIDLADMESSYDANITNNIGAKGYFQLMPFNRAKSWSSPTQQFHEMFKLTDSNLDYFKKNLTKEDWAKADRMGIDIYGLLAGAHLGGVNGALNALRGKSNAKDSNGTSVMHYMKKFSQHPSRDSIFSNLERQVTNLKSQAADFVMRHSNSDVSELQENIFNTDNTDGSWHVPMMLPSNPTVFSNLTQFTQPSWIPQRPDISEVFKAYDESKKQEELAEKQAERQQHMNNMRFFMNLMDYGKPKGDGSSFMSTIGMLAGNGMNNNPYSLDSKGNGGNSKGSELTLMPMFGNMYAGGDKIERRKGVKGGEPVEYYDASEVMPIVADNMGKSIVLDEVEVTPYRKIPIQDTLFEGITNQAANERADEYTNKTSLTPGRFLGLMGANVPLAAGALGATVAAPALFDSTIAPLSDYVAGTKAGQTITGLLGNPYFNAAVEAGFAGHGLNHAVNEGIDGWGDAAMTALEVAPLGKLARPMWNAGRNSLGLLKDDAKAFYNNLTMDLNSVPGRFYHGSPSRTIEEFIPGDSGGIYFTPTKKAARGYTGSLGTGRVYEANLNLGNSPVVVDARGKAWNAIPEEEVAKAFGMPKEEIYKQIGHYNAGAEPWYSDFLKPFGYSPNTRSYAVDQLVALGKDLGKSSLTIKGAKDSGKGLFGYKQLPYDQTIVYRPEQISLLEKSHPIKSNPQITTENAASNSGVMADAEDFSFKVGPGIDSFTRRWYDKKIHGQNLMDFSGKTFSPDVKKGISNKTKEEIRNNVVRRNMREFMNDGLTSSEVAPYATKVEELMDDINVGIYSQSDYEKAGWDGFGGFYDPKRNFISINREAEEKGLSVEPHEVRHAIDHNIDDEILTPTSETFGKDFDSNRVLSSMQRTRQKQNMILYDAYDNDFIDIPNKSGYNEGFENSSMEREAITTNRDAREVLLGSKKDWDPNLTDKIIDKMPDTAIFEAVERANGYGRRFIKFLRENNKLTPKKAQQFREAMKHVGVYAVPVGMTLGTSAATLYNKSK